MKVSIYELERKGDVESIIKVLKSSKNTAVRARALESLGNIGDQNAIKTLIDTITSESDDSLKIAAAEAIAWADESVLKTFVEKISGQKIKGAKWVLAGHFIKLLGRPEVSFRTNAAIALGRLGEKKAVKALSNSLKDTSPKVRKASAIALGMIEDPAAINPLVEALKDSNPSVKVSVLEALNDLGISNRHVEEVSKCLKNPDPRIRELGVLLLGKGGEDSVEPLLSVINDNIKEVRVAAVHSLIDLLSKISSSRSEDVRKEISKRIRNIHNIADIVIEILEKSENTSTRRNVVWVLGQIADIRGVRVLIKILEEGTPEERRLASTSLMKIPQSAQELAARIKHEDEEVRRLICWILGEIGDPSVKQAIEDVMEDPSDNVRSMAFQAMFKLKKAEKINKGITS